MTVSVWQADDSQALYEEVDVLVVGAGLIGTTAAYFLKQALPSGAKVVVTDMRDVALGASGRNAGFMITGLDTYYHHAVDHYGHDTVREIYRLSQKTHVYWRAFAKKGNVRLEEIGSMLLAESASEARDLRLAYDAMTADGIEPIFHDTDPLGRGFFAAIEQPWDAAVHPVELARAILAQSGAKLIDNNELYRMEQRPNGGVDVYTRKYRFHARKVFLATNAYSVFIDPYFVGKVIPTRAQCLVTTPLETPVLNTCGYSDYGFMYYRTTFDNRLLIGGGRKQYKALENDTTEDRISQPVQDKLDAYLRDRFPDVDAPVDRRWSGIMGFTPDGLPLLGTMPDKPDIGFAVGFNGHGLALGAGATERAIDHLLSGASPGVLSVQRPMRAI